METTKKLVMTFLSDEDRKVSLSIEDPRPNVTENEIKECMELIFDRCRYDTDITIKEFENYLINAENMKK